MRIVIAEDDPLLREGVALILRAEASVSPGKPTMKLAWIWMPCFLSCSMPRR